LDRTAPGNRGKTCRATGQATFARFAAERPNQVWLSDITYVPTEKGWLYLAVVLDPFTRKIVGWAMRDLLRTELTIAALTTAIKQQKPSNR
jgi:putative transposase